MIATRPLVRSLAAVALLCTTAISQAAIVSFTSRTLFTGTNPVAIDRFTDLTIDSANQNPLGTSLTRSAGPFGYTVSAATDFYAAPVAGTIALTAGDVSDVMMFSNFTANGTGPVYNFGANFFATDILGEAISSTNALIQQATAITVIAREADGDFVTVLFTGTNPITRFAGFRSDEGIVSVEAFVTNPLVDGITSLFVTADNITFVPEPSSLMLVLAAGLAVPLVRRRA